MRSDESRNTSLAYEGAFTIDTLSFFGNYIKNILNINALTRSKLYKIFFELSQNIAYYSLDRENLKDSDGSVGIGSFILTEYESHIMLETYNTVMKKEGKIITDYCKEINKFTVSELRDLKACKRRHNGSKTDGAHIGLVQVCILSLNPIDFGLKNIDNNTAVLRLSCKINKNYKTTK